VVVRSGRGVEAGEGMRRVGVRLLGRPGEKENGPGRRGIVIFLFIQIIFKRGRIVLIQRWAYQAPKISNKICI
jgi:hypothetical protein